MRRHRDEPPGRTFRGGGIRPPVAANSSTGIRRSRATRAASARATGSPFRPRRTSSRHRAASGDGANRYDTNLPFFASTRRPARFSSRRCSETVDGAEPRTAVIWQTQRGPPESMARTRSRAGCARALAAAVVAERPDFVISAQHEMYGGPDSPDMIRLHQAPLRGGVSASGGGGRRASRRGHPPPTTGRSSPEESRRL